MKKFLAFLGILILVAAVAGYFLYPRTRRARPRTRR